MYCQNCGAQLPDKSKFCNNCGANVSETIQLPTETAKAEKAPKGRIQWGKLIIAILLLLLFAVGCFVAFDPNTRDLYIYTKSAVYSDYDVTFEAIEQNFAGTYLLKNSDGYAVIDIDTGLGFLEEDLKGIDDSISVEFSSHGNYALIEIEAAETDETIRISYTKVNLLQRLHFLSKYYY